MTSMRHCADSKQGREYVLMYHRIPFSITTISNVRMYDSLSVCALCLYLLLEVIVSRKLIYISKEFGPRE